MNQSARPHYWLRGGLRRDRSRALLGLGISLDAPDTLVVDAHRRLRGPFTAAGTLARALVPGTLPRDPALVGRYDIELLSAAPELHNLVPNSRETLTSMAIPAERTRYYARLRTVRIGNGLVEFVHDAAAGEGLRTVVVEQVDQADPTDLEFLANLVRRVDPARLQVVICMPQQEPADPDLLAVLREHAVLVEVAAATEESVLDPADYVMADCVSDEPADLAAYLALDPAARAALHDRRAEQIEALDQESLRVGALAHHREHGSEPGEAGVKAVFHAMDHCLCLGFYAACVEYGQRGLALVDAVTEHDRWWAFAKGTTLALSILGRTEEAELMDDQARFHSTKPGVHMNAAYSTAMLYTRHNDPERRDQRKAKSWLNAAIATASLIEDPHERAFQSAFYRNGLALVEVNLGAPQEALRLVDECIDMLDRLLPDDSHVLHRSVLKNNRARVYLALGRLDDALADYEVVIREDPNHAEHHLERGTILRRLGRSEEALADYAKALRLSPPFPEIYYNRGDLRFGEGDVDGALADFSYVLDLQPDFVDAYVNRAGLLLDAGDLESAREDALAGLRHDPENPYLHAVLGQYHVETEDLPAARASYDRALKADPDLVIALSGRAGVAYAAGDLALATEDLTRAVTLDPQDPALRYNLALVHRDAGRPAEALAELRRAAENAPDDEDIAHEIAALA
ncbi:tetratricopeptide repeat protein [Streptacidiphilus jiangxiensis]|uniref:Tfp pilus assembly protein PilF n=1 Tax=Streptacidiphilus jiangxiensis TaxID=235985 RepID=A0A1H7IDB5_STRJI|nr:tetratricopeptide repeat protein [Streptacidiphilus jiangxiensis]SEK59832.1 Tfp pilus assembly protein PilF [Streptacidiphilus jiangxiensis]